MTLAETCVKYTLNIVMKFKWQGSLSPLSSSKRMSNTALLVFLGFLIQTAWPWWITPKLHAGRYTHFYQKLVMLQMYFQRFI